MLKCAVMSARKPPHAEDPLGLGRPPRVLVVDDDDDTRDMLQMLLASLGWSVVVASSGVDAIERFDPAAIDLILTDVGMAEMDGFMLLERLRELPPPHTPAIAVTGYGGDETAVRIREVGFDGHLTKPFHLVSLIEMLREIAARRGE